MINNKYNTLLVGIAMFASLSASRVAAAPPPSIYNGTKSLKDYILDSNISHVDRAIVYIVPSGEAFRTTIGIDALPKVACTYTSKVNDRNIIPMLLDIIKLSNIEFAKTPPRRMNLKFGIVLSERNHKVFTLLKSREPGNEIINSIIDNYYAAFSENLENRIENKDTMAHFDLINTRREPCEKF
jgi:hypothetical protein